MPVDQATNELMRQYRQIIHNATGEIGSRLMLITQRYEAYDLKTLCVELDLIRDQLAKIQRGFIYIKNKGGRA